MFSYHTFTRINSGSTVEEQLNQAEQADFDKAWAGFDEAFSGLEKTFDSLVEQPLFSNTRTCSRCGQIALNNHRCPSDFNNFTPPSNESIIKRCEKCGQYYSSSAHIFTDRPVGWTGVEHECPPNVAHAQPAPSKQKPTLQLCDLRLRLLELRARIASNADLAQQFAGAIAELETQIAELEQLGKAAP